VAQPTRATLPTAPTVDTFRNFRLEIGDVADIVMVPSPLRVNGDAVRFNEDDARSGQAKGNRDRAQPASRLRDRLKSSFGNSASGSREIALATLPGSFSNFCPPRKSLGRREDTAVEIARRTREQMRISRAYSGGSDSTHVASRRIFCGESVYYALVGISSSRKSTPTRPIVRGNTRSRCSQAIEVSSKPKAMPASTISTGPSPRSDFPRRTDFACWAKARHKIYDVRAETDSPAARGVGRNRAAVRRRSRSQRAQSGLAAISSAPILEELKAFLEATLAKISGKSSFAAAIRYPAKPAKAVGEERSALVLIAIGVCDLTRPREPNHVGASRDVLQCHGQGAQPKGLA
jgi:hypothetical protein